MSLDIFLISGLRSTDHITITTVHAQSYPLKAASQPVFSSNSTWRATAHTYCRPIPFPVSKGGERPQSPHLSWLFKRYLLLGVQSAVIPAGVDLLSPRVGRAIAVKHGAARFYGLLHVQSTPIALYPASSEIPFVPPFPGVSPAWIYDPSHPESCFVDGTLGAFDHRHYAQLFNHRCPWGPFHDNPLSLDYHASSCEIQTVGAFFIWNQPGNPTRGGRWSKQRLLDLFRQRDRYEGEFHALMHEPVADEFQKKFRDATQRARDYDLPFYDPLEYTETLQWGSFGEGRDRLAHTLRYTADMKAIVRWYQAECAFQNFRGDSTTLPPPNPDIMGTWAPTIDTKRRWTFLMHSCVPIYMIARIPSGHPLLNQAIPGNLDADERYRKNEYDVEHSLQEEWHAPLCNTFESFPLLPLETASYHLPESLIAPQSVPCRDNQKSTSYRLTWRSCIFLDDTIPRILCDEDISQKDWSQLRHKCDSSLFPFLPPSYRLLRADTDRHPLLDVIGSCKGHGNRIQRYEEVYDAEIDGYYPRKREHVTSISNYLRDTALYRFFFEREGVEILSGYPFPGRSLSFGRVNYDSSEEDKEKDATAVLQIPSRRYFFHRPEGYTPDDNTPLPEPVFTWQPLDGSDTAPINQAPIVACRYPVVPTMLIDGDGDPRLQLMTRDIAGNDYQFTIMDDPILALELKLITFKAKMSRQSEASKVFEDYVTELSTIAPVSEEERESHFFRARRLSEFARQRDPNHVLPHVRTPEELEEDIRHYDYLSQQRTRLHTNLSQRLFRPRFSDRLIAPKLTSWQIYGGTDRDVCFPVRIASLDGNVATETLFSMLYKMLDIDPHEVVVFSTYLEADSTRTFDLGMRFAEDAVLVRLFLHGTEIDGRYIEVQFLRGMAGKLSATGYPTNPKEHERRDWDLRMRRVEGAMITTGIDADLLGDAWAVRRALSRVKFRANPTHTTQALIQGYRENAVPVQNSKYS